MHAEGQITRMRARESWLADELRRAVAACHLSQPPRSVGMFHRTLGGNASSDKTSGVSGEATKKTECSWIELAVCLCVGPDRAVWRWIGATWRGALDPLSTDLRGGFGMFITLHDDHLDFPDEKVLVLLIFQVGRIGPKFSGVL